MGMYIWGPSGGGVNARCYTLVHGFCFFKLNKAETMYFIMGPKKVLFH